ncbi:MAG: aldo/keto reductase [Acidobacteriota bacterium]|nr:aldo/keto reductase [Acidobacteriota bacterium]
MDYRNLGGAGVKVSPLCLGTMMFGEWGNRDHEDCVRIIHRALDAGINFIDTANMYSEGESESIVGRALQDRRNQAVLATKVYFPMGKNPNARGLSRKAIEEQVEHSLRRLQTDCIDLYQIHRPDRSVPWEETLRAMDDLVRRGMVRYIGCSTNHHEVQGEKPLAAWEIVETLWISERHGWERFVCLQPPYSILRRTLEDSHFPMTQAHGIANIVWSPLEGGWLTGKYRKGQSNPADSPRAKKWVGDLEQERFEHRLEVVEELVRMADDADASLAELALRWTLEHPAVTSAIIGPRTMEQLESCIRATEVELSGAMLSRIDELVPPGTSVL